MSQFKFYDTYDPSLIYTATKNGDEYLIEWKEDDGEIDYCMYPKQRVDDSLSKGKWVIVHTGV